ncbi:cytochrome P450 [Streptomyces sp. SAI-135]|uniref:cytochrome P450 family protein n=1 Tax=unclassified Streptomyces TaxID=2593676 RepID=UPI0024749334|nr:MULTISPECIES: cytochrome P450 [unclassified Streptomyces]MDH6523417.1 cytochrome P450 [Streptomyces sp. SAI-090]MDH6555039.1 cytochrome P450 [Streptomyces sp. SAI-041]MDH6574304.1 cytochrome P450 [Streptomyces sp. SAI-117]MDH6580964.1 cytochrome P450 [Streptomyces sp. SAI-133]MDH6612970.1 cytochrome P450 [Streptomyces sp. SAI-135]
MTDIVDLGEFGEEFRRDPHPVYAQLRARGPVHRVRLPEPDPRPEVWLIVGYEQARAALADPRLAKDDSKNGFTAFDEELIGKHLLAADPPQHTRLRSLITRAFTPRRVEELQPRIQQITDELLDAMLPQGRADLIESFAYPLPITVICELLGVPELDRTEFRKISNDAVLPADLDSMRDAFVRLADYLDRLIEDKQRGGPGTDLLSDLIRTTAEDGDRLSPDELRGMAYVLLVAGHETTVNLITNAVHALLTHPDQLTALRADMTLLHGTVEEALRYEGPVETATYRFAAEPLEIAGVPIAKGEWVLVGLAAADRDGDRFSAPERFDIRRDTRGHVAFGHGIHHCLGAPLARLEARIALRSLLERAPDLALDGPPREWLPGVLMRGVRSLPVRW